MAFKCRVDVRTRLLHATFRQLRELVPLICVMLQTPFPIQKQATGWGYNVVAVAGMCTILVYLPFVLPGSGTRFGAICGDENRRRDAPTDELLTLSPLPGEGEGLGYLSL